MSRLFILIFANLALPFLLWAARLYFLKWMENRRATPTIIEVNPMDRAQWPIGKLVLAGMVLLAITLLTIRFVGTEATGTSWQTPNTVRTTE